MTRISRVVLVAALSLCAASVLLAAQANAPGPGTLAGTACGSSVCAPKELCCTGCEGVLYCASKLHKWCPLPVCPIPPSDASQVVPVVPESAPPGDDPAGTVTGDDPAEPRCPVPAAAPGASEPSTAACRMRPECSADADCDAVCGPGGGRCVHNKCPIRICKCG